MTVLSVNVNKVAALRNARGGDYPSVLWAAQICIDAGVAGITVHPRPDLRHIRPDDVTAIAALLAEVNRSRKPTVEYNLEGNPFEGEQDDYPGFIELVEAVRPTQATLVPDAQDQITSNHGWNLRADGARLAPAIERLKACGCRVSLFMDPDSRDYARARDLGADRIELYTEAYAQAHAAGDTDEALARYANAAAAAQALGLGVNAGHDLNLANLGLFVTIPEVLEVSIGHALIGDALEFGLAATVKKYLDCL